MSTTSAVSNPLTTLLERRRAEEEQARLEAEASAAAKRAEREAAELERRKQAKLQYLSNEVHDFAEGFLSAVASHAERRNWSASAIEDAVMYAEALLCSNDRELPNINVGIMKVVRSKFAFGLALGQAHYPNIFEQQRLVGMRQDWFAEAFDDAVKSVVQFRQNKRHHR